MFQKNSRKKNNKMLPPNFGSVFQTLLKTSKPVDFELPPFFWPQKPVAWAENRPTFQPSTIEGFELPGTLLATDLCGTTNHPLLR